MQFLTPGTYGNREIYVMLLGLILLVIGRLYDVSVLVPVTVTQGLFPLARFKRPNK